MKSSVVSESNCEDIYHRGSIALNKEALKTGEANQGEYEQEEVRIVATGPISEYCNQSTIPPELNYMSRKIARIAMGAEHAVFLFSGMEIAVCGMNSRGQLGLPIKDSDKENRYVDLNIVKYELFQNNRFNVIDIAAGTYHTMFLVEPNDPDPTIETEQRQVYVCGDRNMLGKFKSKNCGEPQLVHIERFEDNPKLKIKFIYASNEKCIVMDSENGLTLWGRDFDGFLQRDPILFWEFKHAIKKLAVGTRHGLAVDEHKKLYAWGDGTYGEIGDDKENELISSETPVKMAFFDNKDIKVHSISAGGRHSIVVDTEGKMYSFGDNSTGQLGCLELRQYHPIKLDANFEAMAVFSGQTHNIVKSKDGRLYSWGGDSKFKSSNMKGTSLIKYMYELKGKRTSNIHLSENNTIIVSHLKIFVN